MESVWEWKHYLNEWIEAKMLVTSYDARDRGQAPQQELPEPKHQ